jgi:hypothetical protein
MPRCRLALLVAVLAVFAASPAAAESLFSSLLSQGGLPVPLQVPTAPGIGAMMAPVPGMLCRQAIAAATQEFGIPPGLMAAMGRVESGRRDPQSGAWHPWPWTVDAAGEGHFYESKAEAIAAVREFQARGIASIDVGCMQVNIMHHPDAFASLDLAFDPQTNARYAARFLKQLYGQTADWPRAAGLYHSATPALGLDYQNKVMAVLPDEQRGAFGGGAALAMAGVGWQSGFAPIRPTAHGGTLGMGPMVAFSHAPPPHVILLPAPPGGGPTPPGRSLSAYRAAPVLLATRLPLAPARY